MATRAPYHRWTAAQDTALLKCVATIRPVTTQNWDLLVDTLNSESPEKVKRRMVKDRFELLLKNYAKDTNKRLAE